jgi:hypothetical protein
MPLYEPAAGFASQPGSLSHGLPGVHNSLAGFIAIKGTLDLKVTRVLQASDLALVVGVWSFYGNWAKRWTCEADGTQRGCSAPSGRRLLALRDRNPCGTD